MAAGHHLHIASLQPDWPSLRVGAPSISAGSSMLIGSPGVFVSPKIQQDSEIPAHVYDPRQTL